jgi:hypothetical protein
MNLALDPVSGTRYSIGTWVGLPIAIVVLATAALILAVAVRLIVKNWNPETGNGDAFASATLWGIGALIAVTVTAVVFAATWWPFNWEYHQWRPVRGEVTQIDKRMLSDGDKGMSEMFVVRFADRPDEYRCDDSRCAAVKPGDVLELTCKKKWQWTGTHGRECSFVETVRR